jgi:very-short-patch-repair endonuclease
VLSFGAAARLWGFETWQRSAVEITELRGRSCALDAVRCHRSTVFEIDSTVHQGIPVTTAARTIIDLSGRLDVPALGRLTDEGLRRRLFRIEELAECASRLRSARGRRMKVVHAVLRLRIAGYDPGESGFEARVASVLTKLQGAPPVVHQHPVCIGGRNYRIDLAHPTLLLAHECDGWSFHNTRTAFSNDRARANDLAAAGWTVLRYTTDMTNAAIARYAVDTINRLRRCA